MAQNLCPCRKGICVVIVIVTVFLISESNQTSLKPVSQSFSKHVGVLPASELSGFLKQIPYPNPKLLDPNPWDPDKGAHWILKTIDLHSRSNICVPVGHYILLLTFLTFCQSHKELESSTSRSKSGGKCSRPLKWFSNCLYSYYVSIVTVSLCSTRAESWNTISSYCAFILARLKEFLQQKPHMPFNTVKWFSEWSPGKKHQYHLGT